MEMCSGFETLSAHLQLNPSDIRPTDTIAVNGLDADVITRLLEKRVA
jgi:hypothetical protein